MLTVSSILSRSLFSPADGCGQCKRGTHDWRTPKAFCIIPLAVCPYTMRISRRGLWLQFWAPGSRISSRHVIGACIIMISWWSKSVVHTAYHNGLGHSEISPFNYADLLGRIGLELMTSKRSGPLGNTVYMCENSLINVMTRNRSSHGPRTH